MPHLLFAHLLQQSTGMASPNQLIMGLLGLLVLCAIFYFMGGRDIVRGFLVCLGVVIVVFVLLALLGPTVNDSLHLVH